MEWSSANARFFKDGWEITRDVRGNGSRHETVWQNPPADDRQVVSRILRESTPFTLLPKASDPELILETRLTRFRTDGHGRHKCFFTVQVQPEADGGKIQRLIWNLPADPKIVILETGQDRVCYTAWDGFYLIRIFFRRCADTVGLLPAPPAYLALTGSTLAASSKF